MTSVLLHTLIVEFGDRLTRAEAEAVDVLETALITGHVTPEVWDQADSLRLLIKRHPETTRATSTFLQNMWWPTFWVLLGVDEPWKPKGRPRKH